MTTTPEGHWHFSTLTCDAFICPDNGITSNSQLQANIDIARAKMAQEALSVFPLHLSDAIIWDSAEPLHRFASDNDDLWLRANTLGSSESPTIETNDKASNGAVETQYAAWLGNMPLEYDASATVEIRVSIALEAVADVSATVDVEFYEIDRDGGVGSDLCTTAAVTCNSTSYADKDFTITDTDLLKGEPFLVRVAVAIRDNATGANVYAKIGAVELLADTRG